MEDAVEDEIISLNSIYGDGTLTSVSKHPRICALRVPSLPSVVLRLDFPSDYPDQAPRVVGTETIGKSAPKGSGISFVNLAQATVKQLFNPGNPCVYDLVEELGTAIKADAQGSDEVQDIVAISVDDNPPHKDADQLSPSSPAVLAVDPPWTVTAPIVEKKSVFIGRAVPVSSPVQAKEFLQHLLATDKKVAKATHNITAWRIHGEDDTIFQDCDDDGETAAGGRILHLLQLMDVWDVMVVVSRWYGGVLLGPDRFRIINQSARDAVVTGGFAKEAKGNNKKSKR
jgi:hypothetical protein